MMNDLQQALERQNLAESDKAGGRREEQHNTSSYATERETGKANSTVTERITEGLNRTKKFRKYKPLNVLEYSQTETTRRYYIIRFSEEARRSVNPYAMIEKITEMTGIPPVKVMGNNRGAVTMEIERRYEKIRAIDKIDDIPCQVMMHPKYIYSKGLIYVYECDLEDMQAFKEGLQLHYDIVDVQQATFNKTKFPQTQAFIVTFKGDNLPYSIYRPGERQDTRVFKFRNKSLMCNNCHKYGHVNKWCKQDGPTCRRCSASGHAMD